ncbi:NAD(P)-dependent alcohol dehydrogenase [Nocardioides guangzhouensis]|uniref:NAD(P)-dependent alcohol dehydrogenase n=1 Tax=Nocardioides guangzhouensis TaxID=2497878 RepID=A0A4Q4ZK14_9ACTN|nr:NAD(P)-dependent alcohol dehydrogenase [Nocardioides guangzhouensis]RYP88348.1 NAD(P)-dependent alcohol dehydrogenase [Nocardioides guangzhouensis]
MKAIRQDRYGGPERLELREVPAPVPGKGEVLVRVRAAAVDQGTVHLMTGLPLLMRPFLGFRGPRTPTIGRDLAGVVEAVGEGVTRFAVGDEVFGSTGGSFAELTVAREDHLAHKPASLDFTQAAAVPISGMTALQAVRDARVRAGQRVLVIGASGGVGSYAVQLAAAAGAEVVGVAGPTKLDLVRELGAAEVLDHTRDDLGRGAPYDAILDIGGNRPVTLMRSWLTPTGALVIVGGEGGGRVLGGMGRPLAMALRAPFTHHRLVMLASREKAEHVEELARLADEGAYRPVVDRTFPLADAAKAVAHVQDGHARGKVVVAVS